MIKLTAVVAAAMASALAVGPSADAETFVLRFGSGHPSKPTPYVRNMERYLADEIAKRVAAETEHKVRVIHAYAGKIAKVHETLEAVEKGLLDIGGWCVCFESAKMLPMNFDYFTPFTTGDIRKQLEVKLRVMAEHPELYDMLDKKYNQKLIALTGFDNYGLGTKFEWTDVNQLKGKKIIAAGPNLPWVERFGAIPVTTTLPTANPAIVRVKGSDALPRSTPNSSCTAGRTTTTAHIPMLPMVASSTDTASRNHAPGPSIGLAAACVMTGAPGRREKKSSGEHRGTSLGFRRFSRPPNHSIWWVERIGLPILVDAPRAPSAGSRAAAGDERCWTYRDMGRSRSRSATVSASRSIATVTPT